MDATIKGKLNFYNQQNQMLANSANDAVNYYNTIIKTQFDNKFWQLAGLAGGVGALLVKGANVSLPSVILPEAVTTAASGGTLALPPASSVAALPANPMTYSVAVGEGVTVEGISAAAWEAENALLAEAAATGGAEAVTTGGVAGGAAAGGISVALPYIIAGIAAYIAGKAIGEVGGQYYCYKKGKEQLEELVRDVTLLRSYCKVMSSQISTALSSLSSASVYISVAEKKIVDQEYKTKYKNLQSIRERQAEVQSLANCLKATQKVVDIIFNNLSAVA